MTDRTTKANDKCSKCNKMCMTNLTDISGIDEARWKHIMDTAVRKKYRKGSYLFREGDPCDAIYLLISGKVKLRTFDAEGREEIAGIFWFGEVIWEGIFIEDSTYPYDAVCIDTTDCCKLSRAEFEEFMSDPNVAPKVITLLSRKLRAANERVLLLTTEDPKARLAGFLLRQSKYAESDTVVMRLEEISASIHLRPETVSRKIKELQKDGMIEKTGQSSIRLLNYQGLRDTFKQ